MRRGCSPARESVGQPGTTSMPRGPGDHRGRPPAPRAPDVGTVARSRQTWPSRGRGRRERWPARPRSPRRRPRRGGPRWRRRARRRPTRRQRPGMVPAAPAPRGRHRDPARVPRRRRRRRLDGHGAAPRGEEPVEGLEGSRRGSPPQHAAGVGCGAVGVHAPQEQVRRADQVAVGLVAVQAPAQEAVQRDEVEGGLQRVAVVRHHLEEPVRGRTCGQDVGLVVGDPVAPVGGRATRSTEPVSMPSTSSGRRARRRSRPRGAAGRRGRGGRRGPRRSPGRRTWTRGRSKPSSSRRSARRTSTSAGRRGVRREGPEGRGAAHRPARRESPGRGGGAALRPPRPGARRGGRRVAKSTCSSTEWTSVPKAVPPGRAASGGLDRLSGGSVGSSSWVAGLVVPPPAVVRRRDQSRVAAQVRRSGASGRGAERPSWR